MSETEKLKSGFSNSQLFDRGLQLTDLIKQLEERNLNFSEEIEHFNQKIKEYQDKAMEKVAKATDDSSKKKYTNESQRIVAMRNLLRDWQGYHQCLTSVKVLKKSQKLNDIEIKYRVYRLRLINSYIQQTPE